VEQPKNLPKTSMVWSGSGGFLQKWKGVPLKPVFSRTQTKLKRCLRVTKIQFWS
jgi:hypothetical protein